MTYLRQGVQFYMRLVCFFFVIFGLLVALPLVVWDVTSRIVFYPVAIVLTFVSTFVPIGVIAWLNIEHDPLDAEVPFRMRQDAAVRASIATGIFVGAAAIVWLMI